MRTSIVLAAFVGLVSAVVFGCSESKPDDASKSDAQAKVAAPATSRTTSETTRETTRETPGNAAPGTPQGGHDDLPPSCTAEKDCANVCPAGTKGCTCAETPDGKRCIPTCTTDADCAGVPDPMGGKLSCAAEKVCMPADR